jgi:hypothetical protein
MPKILMKECSTSLAIKELQIKTTIRVSERSKIVTRAQKQTA